jgi:hypothetical protein
MNRKNPKYTPAICCAEMELEKSPKDIFSHLLQIQNGGRKNL